MSSSSKPDAAGSIESGSVESRPRSSLRGLPGQVRPRKQKGENLRGWQAPLAHAVLSALLGCQLLYTHLPVLPSTRGMSVLVWLSIGWVNLRCLHTQRCCRCACPCTCSCRHGLPPNGTFRASSACRHMFIRGILHKRNFYIHVKSNSTTKLVCRARDTKGWDAQVREQEKSAK